MWMYKICQGNKKNYTVVDRCEDRHEAIKRKENWYWYNKKTTFIKRYSEKEV